LRAHHVLGCRGFSRTDVRLSAEGIPYILEVNPLPGLDPVDSNFPVMARAAGVTYDEMLEAIVASALEGRAPHAGMAGRARVHSA